MQALHLDSYSVCWWLWSCWFSFSLWPGPPLVSQASPLDCTMGDNCCRRTVGWLARLALLLPHGTLPTSPAFHFPCIFLTVREGMIDSRLLPNLPSTESQSKVLFAHHPHSPAPSHRMSRTPPRGSSRMTPSYCKPTWQLMLHTGSSEPSLVLSASPTSSHSNYRQFFHVSRW